MDLRKDEAREGTLSSAMRPLSEQGYAAKTVSLPPFWTADPELWFAVAEAQFVLKGLAPEKMFYQVITCLPSDAVPDVRDIVLQPPSLQALEALKLRLIRQAPSIEQRRIQELLDLEGLCGRSPSNLLNQLRHLLSGRPRASNETLLRDAFLRRLPDSVRRILGPAVCDLGLDILAQLADRVLELVAPQTLSPVLDPLVDSELQRLRNQVSRLEQKVEELSLRRAETAPLQTTPSRSGSVDDLELLPENQPSPPQKPQPEAPDVSGEPHLEVQSKLCWYHRLHGHRAAKCVGRCPGRARPSEPRDAENT